MMKKQYQQKGQAMMEYIIITCVVGIFCLVGFKNMGRTMENRLGKANEYFNHHIQIKGIN